MMHTSVTSPSEGKPPPAIVTSNLIPNQSLSPHWDGKN